MNNNIVDNSTDIGYNVNNDDNEVVVDLSAIPPLNDVECPHTTIVVDPEDTIGNAVYHGCQNPKCGRGWYIHPMQ